MIWLANAETYLNDHPKAVIALIAVAALLVLVVWLWVPARLTSRRKYETRGERIKDTDRYRRIIGQLLIVPVLVVASLYALHEVSRAARESAETSRQERYSYGFQALADGNVAARLGGVYALAQLIGGDRPDVLCPDGNQSPLSGTGGGTAFSVENRLYRVVLEGIAAQAVASSHLGRSPDGDAAHRPREEASHEAVVGADTRAALAVIARRGCEPYSKEVPLDLARGYFRGVSMAYAQLIRSDLRNSDLSASELYLANFYQASLDKADFGGSNLTRASFANASLAGANFGPDENLASPDLPRLPRLRTQLGGAQIVTANAQGADFHCAMMNDARLDDSQIGGADFRHATLARAMLLGARGQGARFSTACAPGANFSNPPSISAPSRPEARRSDFSGADFSEGFFRSARFDNIDLRNANFVRADLTGANFGYSDLTNVDFRGANLTGVRFDGANLTGVKMGGALICDVTGLPESVARANCGGQFLPIEAARYGEGCQPAIEVGAGQNQQCPFEPEGAVVVSAPTTAAN
ncbi:pentapeptide repeat-containing protein [Inquilinus limosus]|nr:pentapeptide repeat-containing protein [Inquilinus limosus]